MHCNSHGTSRTTGAAVYRNKSSQTRLRTCALFTTGGFWNSFVHVMDKLVACAATAGKESSGSDVAAQLTSSHSFASGVHASLPARCHRSLDPMPRGSLHSMQVSLYRAQWLHGAHALDRGSASEYHISILFVTFLRNPRIEHSRANSSASMPEPRSLVCSFSMVTQPL